jgi:DNA-binding LytR/AlgR family response regulator
MGRVYETVQKPECIVYLTSESNYTWIYYDDGTKELFSRHLSWFERYLPTFVRTHKSVLVNPAFVSNVERQLSVLILQNGKSVPVSRRRWVYTTGRVEKIA